MRFALRVDTEQEVVVHSAKLLCDFSEIRGVILPTLTQSLDDGLPILRTSRSIVRASPASLSIIQPSNSTNGLNWSGDVLVVSTLPHCQVFFDVLGGSLGRAVIFCGCQRYSGRLRRLGGQGTDGDVDVFA
jgi:hypothetical protein